MAVGRSVLEALRLVEASQAVQTFGVLCPADWKSGGDIIIDSYYDRIRHKPQEFSWRKVNDRDHADNQRFHRPTEPGPPLLAPAEAAVGTGASAQQEARARRSQLEEQRTSPQAPGAVAVVAPAQP